MSNLFELNDTYRQLVDSDLEGQALIDTLEAIQDEREVKLDYIATMIDELKSDVEWAKERRVELLDKQRATERKVKSLMDYLTEALDDAGIKKVQTKNHILKPRNYRASVVVKSLDDLPAEYIREKNTVSADKTALYKALKAGVEVSGAELKPNRGTQIM